jgi:predicted 3-demethylubiquinone-9 3-methyltransferase (glyoxalase superfamily)
MKIQQKITTFLWFNNNAEEAINFYATVFNGVKINNKLINGKNGPGPEGSLLGTTFEIEGQEFYALNGGPHYAFTPAISLYVTCDSQEEVDEKWAKLTADGGKEVACGWLEDKFGLSWQIVPSILDKMIRDEDPAKAERVMTAMMNMVKLDFKKITGRLRR